MHIPRFLFAWLAFCLLIPCALADAPTTASLAAPSLIRPGQSCEFTVDVAVDCSGTLILVSADTGRSHRILTGVDLTVGENIILWNGLLPSGQSPDEGMYALQLEVLGATLANVAVRVGPPYPQLTLVSQSAEVLPKESQITITYIGNEQGTLEVVLYKAGDGAALDKQTWSSMAGVNTFQWDGIVSGELLPGGAYELAFTLRNDAGETSQIMHVTAEIPSDNPAPLDFAQITSQLYETYDTKISPPYSLLADGSYWCMNPGETDDAVIWDILTQPITVFDDGKISPIGHVYLRENPDGSGRATAQIHGLSQGLHVIGDVNEYGYVLVEAFSNYDPDYQPYTAEEKAHAFDICQGYIFAGYLKTIEVQQDIGFVIDKLTQRMYMFRDGERVTEFLISTGLITNEKYYYETIAGEFITIGHASGYWSGDIYTDIPIRFNGGTMLHEVCCYVNNDTRYYSIFESRLGSKHSSGCVRVPYWENEEGYNMLWLYRNLYQGAPYKIIIWDDRNRNDSPSVWR